MGSAWNQTYDPSCWESCFGKEAQVTEQLLDIAKNLTAGGIVMDYPYYFENVDNATATRFVYKEGASFDNATAALNFLYNVTKSLRNRTNKNFTLTQAMADAALFPSTPYFKLLDGSYHDGMSQPIDSLDLLLVQYFGDHVLPKCEIRPDECVETELGSGLMSFQEHNTNIVRDILNRDATKLVIGFCFNADYCPLTVLTTDEARDILEDFGDVYGDAKCNSGFIFMYAGDDLEGKKSEIINEVTRKNEHCSTGYPSSAPSVASPTTAVRGRLHHHCL